MNTTTEQCIRMCYINVRSIKNKITYLFDYITSHNYDISAICETWLNCKATNDVYINALLPPGYTIHHVDRDNEATGGGVAIIHKQCLNIKLCVNVKFIDLLHPLLINSPLINSCLNGKSSCHIVLYLYLNS